jgi:hypothetical protein
MRAAFKEINKPKVTRRSQRLASPRLEVADRSRQELTEILDKQKERIEIRRKDSLTRSPGFGAVSDSNISIKSIDNNIDMITSGLKTLTKKVSQDRTGTVLPGSQSKLEPIPPIKPLQRDPQRRGFGVSRRPVTSPPKK